MLCSVFLLHSLEKRTQEMICGCVQYKEPSFRWTANLNTLYTYNTHVPLKASKMVSLSCLHPLRFRRVRWGKSTWGEEQISLPALSYRRQESPTLLATPTHIQAKASQTPSHHKGSSAMFSLAAWLTRDKLGHWLVRDEGTRNETELLQRGKIPTHTHTHTHAQHTHTHTRGKMSTYSTCTWTYHNWHLLKPETEWNGMEHRFF